MTFDTLAVNKLVSLGGEPSDAMLPENGYKLPQQPAHQNNWGRGLDTVVVAQSTVQAETANGLANSTASGLMKNANSSMFQVGSSSDMYIMSRFLIPPALQLFWTNSCRIIYKGNAQKW